jgi:hypothetical protein
MCGEKEKGKKKEGESLLGGVHEHSAHGEPHQ